MTAVVVVVTRENGKKLKLLSTKKTLERRDWVQIRFAWETNAAQHSSLNHSVRKSAGGQCYKPLFAVYFVRHRDTSGCQCYKGSLLHKFTLCTILISSMDKLYNLNFTFGRMDVVVVYWSTCLSSALKIRVRFLSLLKFLFCDCLKAM